MHGEITESAENILSQAGLKRTPGRIAMINLLLSSPHPLSQQEIARRLEKVQINGVSIYRSLHAFLQTGIAHRVESGDRTWRFAICGCGSRGHCHPHFICRQCGKVECLSGFKMPEPEELQPGYVVEEQEVYLRGLCAGCST
ncbi:MAG: Fur family transcriptional regulator [Bacillota bacterium]